MAASDNRGSALLNPRDTQQGLGLIVVPQHRLCTAPRDPMLPAASARGWAGCKQPPAVLCRVIAVWNSMGKLLPQPKRPVHCSPRPGSSHWNNPRKKRHPSWDTDSAHDYLKPCQPFRPFPLQSSHGWNQEHQHQTASSYGHLSWGQTTVPLCRKNNFKIIPRASPANGKGSWNTVAFNVGGKILISLRWHLCCPASKSSLGRGKTTTSNGGFSDTTSTTFSRQSLGRKGLADSYW